MDGNLYRELINSIDDGVCVVDVIFDESGKPVDCRYIEANQGFAEHLGRPEVDVVGRTGNALFPGTEPFWYELIGKVAVSGKSARTVSEHKPTGRWFEVYAFKLGGQESRTVGIKFRDVTEQKRAEEALQTPNRIISALFNNNIVGLSYCKTIFDEHDHAVDYCVLDVNPNYELMTGIPRNQIVGKRITEATPDIPRHFIELHNKVAATGKETQYEIYYHDSNKWYNVNVFSPQIGYFVAVFFNITEQKRVGTALRESERKAQALIRELEESDKNKNRFISVLSHELRNPLAAITASLSLLEVDGTREHISMAKDTVSRQAGQLTKLVDDLLDLTRINKNNIKLKNETVDLADILKNAAADISPQYAEKGVRLTAALSPEPVLLDADPVRLTQCAGNLLQNALKYTPAGGSVALTMETQDGEAVFRVRDSGIGIGPELLEHIFEPFTQADKTLDRRDSSGLGLGLSVVKGLVERHGGSVEASSGGAGKGALFTVRLPAAGRGDPARNGEAAKHAGRVLKILLIEDNKGLADILCSLLSAMGHRATAAHTGAEGIAEAKKIRPDAIFCDIGLPGMNGYEVAEALKADTVLKDSFLIAMTGYTGSREIERARQSGFDRHLAKPADRAALERILEEIPPADF